MTDPSGVFVVTTATTTYEAYTVVAGSEADARALVASPAHRARIGERPDDPDQSWIVASAPAGDNGDEAVIAVTKAWPT